MTSRPKRIDLFLDAVLKRPHGWSYVSAPLAQQLGNNDAVPHARTRRRVDQGRSRNLSTQVAVPIGDSGFTHCGLAALSIRLDHVDRSDIVHRALLMWWNEHDHLMIETLADNGHSLLIGPRTNESATHDLATGSQLSARRGVLDTRPIVVASTRPEHSASSLMGLDWSQLGSYTLL